MKITDPWLQTSIIGAPDTALVRAGCISPSHSPIDTAAIDLY